MNLMNLKNRIEQAGMAKGGVSLFLEMMPLEAQLATLLRNPLSGTRIDYDMPGFYRAEFQLIVRTPGYVAGQALMEKLVPLLTFGELTLGVQAFKHCLPRTLPVAFPLSDGNLVEHSVMFDCVFCEGA